MKDALAVRGPPAPQPSPQPSPRRTTHPQPSLRLFIALWPGPRVRQALAACRDGTRWPENASPIPTEKLHLTLHFIGSVPATRVAEIVAALQVPMRAFELRLDLAECWASGVAVLRPQTVPPRLRQLHADLAAALRRLALPVETRTFRPHISLARRAAASSPRPPAEPVRWRVGGYALVQSTGEGRYELLKRYR